MKRRSGLEDDIRALIAQGLRNKEIAEKLGCVPSRVSQVRNPPGKVLMPSQVDRPEKRARLVSPDTCQRPDARKGFAVCGEPKKRTACGELLGVCDFHFETTKPLGGTKT